MAETPSQIAGDGFEQFLAEVVHNYADMPYGDRLAYQQMWRTNYDRILEASGLPAEVERLRGQFEAANTAYEEKCIHLMEAEALAARYQEMLDSIIAVVDHSDAALYNAVKQVQKALGTQEGDGDGS